ncbi:hypothetical protein [Mycoplasma sp. HU2014]|uniref:hypothetical protein n=1 Tax=Mycoplasma sp. HU2014 TaxID=1664275 RepID=UPI00067C592A|nr:hypothetical protein [Mycoplasma sp. HU2014]KNG79476.1 hypothetical protein AB668_01725 [Mycoplasma sp. HU2014]MBY7703794.1 hypothetical protein [Vibrio harveyi]
MLKEIYLQINNLYNDFKMCSSFSYLPSYNHFIKHNHLIKNITQAREFKKVVNLIYQEGKENNFLNLAIYDVIKIISFKLDYFLNYLYVYYSEIENKSDYIKVSSLIKLSVIIKFEYKKYLIEQNKIIDLLNEFEHLDINKNYETLNIKIEEIIKLISNVLIKDINIKNNNKLNSLYDYLDILSFIKTV